MGADHVTVYEFDASRDRFSYALCDIAEGFSRRKLIVSLIRSEFINKYGSVVIGGFWAAFSAFATATGLALLYSQIFGRSLDEYFPYVAIGIIVWGLMAGLVNDGAAAFTTNAGLFSQTPLPKTIFVLRSLGRAVVFLMFKLFVLIGILLFVGAEVSASAVGLALVGFLILLWLGYWSALLLGTLAARFQELQQLIAISMTFAFFLTPVFWSAERLAQYSFIVTFNPFHHLLNTIRGPLLGLPGVPESFFWSGALCVFVAIAGYLVYGLFARRLPYWC